MTYKKVVEHLIEANARKWLEEILNENGIEYDYTMTMGSTLENDKDTDTIYWETVFTVRVNGIRKSVIVGGTADDLCGICTSVLWDKGKNILWMSVKKTREVLGIETLNL